MLDFERRAEEFFGGQAETVAGYARTLGCKGIQMHIRARRLCVACSEAVDDENQWVFSFPVGLKQGKVFPIILGRLGVSLTMPADGKKPEFTESYALDVPGDKIRRIVGDREEDIDEHKIRGRLSLVNDVLNAGEDFLSQLETKLYQASK